MINESNFSHAYVRTNTKDGIEKSGVIAAVILVFKTEPETQLALWYAKNAQGKPEYFTPTMSVDLPDGHKRDIKCICGGFTDFLIKIASDVQARLKKELGKPTYGKLYKVAEKAEEIQ